MEQQKLKEDLEKEVGDTNNPYLLIEQQERKQRAMKNPSPVALIETQFDPSNCVETLLIK